MVTQGLALTKALGTDMVEKAVTKWWRRGSETQRGSGILVLLRRTLLSLSSPCYLLTLSHLKQLNPLWCCSHKYGWITLRLKELWLSAHSWTHWVSGSLADIRPSSGTHSKKKKCGFFHLIVIFHWTWVKLLDIKDILRITEVKRLLLKV